MSYFLPQLGPNPTFLDGELLGRGQSGKLTHGGTLYLVNQNHPFKLHYSPSSNGAAASAVQKGLKATDKTKGGRNVNEKEIQSSPNPKRSIKDFFSTSPMKVIWHDVVTVLKPMWCIISSCLFLLERLKSNNCK